MVMMWFSASFTVIVAIVHRLSVAGLSFEDILLVLLVPALITALPALISFGAPIVGGHAVCAKLQGPWQWTTVNGRCVLGAMMIVFDTRGLLKALGR